MLIENQKKELLKIARHSIENFVLNKQNNVPRSSQKELNEKSGVFVTLTKFGELRGCIGFPYPDKPLILGVVDAARSVCMDPRFSPLKKNELNQINIEISVMTKPEIIKVKDPIEYQKKIDEIYEEVEK